MPVVMKLITAELRAKLPPLGAQDGNSDPMVFVKLFHPLSNWTWYITEYNPVENMAFGYVDGFEGEWGHISIDELAELRVHGLPMERDRLFEPKPFSKVKETEVFRAQSIG